jgi:dTDP-4-dehydrorhamnose 3,5-epimerase
VKFEATSLGGVLRVIPDAQLDARGVFTRLFDRDAFAARGLVTEFPQHSYVTNVARGVLRGLHYQVSPHEETKVIRCARGSVYDVLVDIRPTSASYGCWEAFELNGDDLVQLYVPAGIAHGYQALTDDAAMHYLISTEYVAEAARGIRYDSPSLAVTWPVETKILSERDRSHPVFDVQR